MKKNINVGKKILVVEDDKDFASILKTKFTTEGFVVVTAGDGQEGLEVAEREKPDLIITDVLMPIMDGIEMAKKIREANKNVLILILTNIQDVDYTKNIEKSVEFDYLIKSELRINDIVGKVKVKLGIK
ncbi:MAG: response regulator [Candidatus Staskawiczbacteria bacterium]|nr:response regulator [Candidatus Staskawiczbacteria bacterium]